MLYLNTRNGMLYLVAICGYWSLAEHKAYSRPAHTVVEHIAKPEIDQMIESGELVYVGKYFG